MRKTLDKIPGGNKITKSTGLDFSQLWNYVRSFNVIDCERHILCSVIFIALIFYFPYCHPCHLMQNALYHSKCVMHFSIYITRNGITSCHALKSSATNCYQLFSFLAGRTARAGGVLLKMIFLICSLVKKPEQFRF